MNEKSARDLVLVRAIELADARNEILSKDDQFYANRAAREHAAWSASERGRPATAEQFLHHRAELVIRKLTERYPGIAFLAKPRLPLGLFSWIVPLLGLLFGAFLDRIADPHRVDLLSLPLLMVIAWNLGAYVVMSIAVLTPNRYRGWRAALAMRLSIGRVKEAVPDALRAGMLAFAMEWPRLALPLNAARIARTLHLTAAMVATGAVLSLYAKGLFVEYSAGWESTFLDARQLHELLSILFAPVQAVFGLQGFTLEEVAALQGNVTAGAGPRWVHLYAATFGLFIIAPRLLLAAAHGVHAVMLARRFPLDLDDPAFQRMAGARGLLLAVPYNYTIDTARGAGLNAVATALLGDEAAVRVAPGIAYGAELAALDQAGVNLVAGVMSLSSTPELENHGAFIAGLVRKAARKVTILVDQSDLAPRSDAQRLRTRFELWREFCTRHGADAVMVDLATGRVL